MKKLFIAPALLLAGWMGAQTTYDAHWQDVNPFSSADQLGGVQVITEPSTGNVFTVGTFKGSINIGGFGLTSTGGKDIYVAKYNSSGTCLKAIKLGSTSDDEAYTLCLRDNYIFVGGFVNSEGMIYKLDNTTPLGVVLSRNLGWGVRPRSLYTYGSTSRMLVGGSFITECDLPKSGGGTIYMLASNFYSEDCSGGCLQSFAGVLDINALFVLASQPYSTSNSNEIINIWCRNGYIYTTGYFRGDMTWASTSTPVTAQGYQDAFVASVYCNNTTINSCTFYNNFIQFGNNADNSSFKECGYGICANSTGVYITGAVSVSGTNPVFGSTTYSKGGAYIARLNYSGSVVGTVNWVRQSEGMSGSAANIATGYGVAVDAGGSVFGTGACEDYVRFEGGSSSPIDISTGDGRPGYIVRYNSSGNIQSGDAFNQSSLSTTTCEGKSIAINGCEVFITGFNYQDQFSAGNITSESVGLTYSSMILVEIGRDVVVSNNVVYCEACASFPNTINLTGSSTSSPITYSWGVTSGATMVNPTTTTPTFSLASCSNSGSFVVTCTMTPTFTDGCGGTPTISVVAGSSAVGVANAGADFDVCPDDVVIMGTNMPDGLTYDWFPQYYLGSTWNQDQPTFTTPSGGLPSAISYTLTVTDVCGNESYDYITVTPDITCPHRMMNPNQPSAQVFPNPSTGIFTVNMDITENEQDVELLITDLTGRTIQQSKITTAGGQHTIDLSSRAKGVYFLTVTRNGVSEVHQLVIE